MGKIVAIGGGEISLHETWHIDQFIVQFSGVLHPRVLFIPTASNDSEGYIATMKKVYGEQLGCEVDTLVLVKGKMHESEIKQKILSAHIIYVGGGDTVKMLEVWRDDNVDFYLKQAYEQNIVLSGLSAGSICWFQKGHSEGKSEHNPDGWWDNQQPIGLGLIPAIHCPHYNERGHEQFDKMLNQETIPGVGIENNCAIVIKDNLYKVVKTDSDSKAYLLHNRNGMFNKTELTASEFVPIKDLFQRVD
ncbi:Type 1 glutamine amidotransferase-like domain-containing protein [Alkalihalobacterium bogoriense]|uniref:Type 1 glutamine amidotransferase-like domain-containing protein n=1 Tax=Alkalihalobacterium bogoriense TaxID=246272 RepID=UPI000479C086|nr:Type 1 glutamine amidotransferase-like domain-containing protein [Alkalihalobacterium bogoriense]